jgi:hypothetical protein
MSAYVEYGVDAVQVPKPIFGHDLHAVIDWLQRHEFGETASIEAGWVKFGGDARGEDQKWAAPTTYLVAHPDGFCEVMNAALFEARFSKSPACAEQAAP